MNTAAIALTLVMLPAALGGQATRWAIRIASPAGVEHGELRLESTGGQLLLESRDTAYLPLADFVRTAQQLTFALAPIAARVVADFSADGSRMDGWFTAANGARRAWQGEVISPGIERWPVRPRIRARQLLFGSPTDVTIIPSAWVHALPDSASLEHEYQELVRQSEFVAIPASDRAERTRAMALGWDPAGRAAARRVLLAIAQGPAADTAFRRIFGSGPTLRLDLHERAEEEAFRRDPGFVYMDAARALVIGGWLPGNAAGEQTRSRAAMLSLWAQRDDGDSAALQRLEMVQRSDRASARALHQLLAGYDQAVPWWREAVQWLMTHAWLETPAGRRSPAALVAGFWGGRTLALPQIRPVVSGGFGATPLVDRAHLAARLFEPLNLSARTWLERGRPAALRAWGRLASGDTISIAAQEFSTALVSPRMAIERQGLRALLADGDAIEIEPGIVPLMAVGIVIHEWHHLLATATRLAAPNVGLAEHGGTLRIRDEDPWLAEGFAEWATEESLRPARTAMPLLALLDTEKRMGLWGGMSDDPHALGYRLVRSAAARLPAATRRAALVDRLHDPASLARLVGFPVARGAPLLLRRPMTGAVVPEITFTWDAGVADHPARRLILPLFSPER